RTCARATAKMKKALLRERAFASFLAERVGFEPTNTREDVTGIPVQRLRPLGHLSKNCSCPRKRACSTGALEFQSSALLRTSLCSAPSGPMCEPCSPIVQVRSRRTCRPLGHLSENCFFPRKRACSTGALEFQSSALLRTSLCSAPSGPMCEPCSPIVQVRSRRTCRPLGHPSEGRAFYQAKPIPAA